MGVPQEGNGQPRAGCSPRPEPSVPRASGLAPPWLLVTELPRTEENPGKAEQRPATPAPARTPPQGHPTTYTSPGDRKRPWDFEYELPSVGQCAHSGPRGGRGPHTLSLG